jgi:predicted RNA polymerase sigma factor
MLNLMNLRIFGLGRLKQVEDVAQDTLCRAMETWPIDGCIPPLGSSGWLATGPSIS